MGLGDPFESHELMALSKTYQHEFPGFRVPVPTGRAALVSMVGTPKRFEFCAPLL